MRQGSKSLLGGNGAAGYLAISVAAATALMLAGGARCWGWGQGGETWETYTPITDPSITSPTVSNNAIGINGEVGFTCSTCTDQDKHTVGGQTSHPWDTVTYTWSATGGTFPYVNTGRSVTWKAPAASGTYMVTVTVDDADGHPPPGTGSDNDDSKNAQRQMKVFVVGMEPSGVTKVMISTKWDDEYPSTAQTEDGKINITATVSCGGQPLQGITLYFDSIDPDDLSPYETDASGDDNHDGPGSVSPTSDTTDAQGKAHTVLTITDQYAGDNYVVRARWPNANGMVVAQSGLLVAWKRIYIEEDKMYRSGCDLTEDVPAEADTISVEGPGLFSVNDVIIVFDADHPTGETATITAINGNNLTLSIDLQNSYHAGYPRTVGRGAAVVEQGTDVYDADLVSRVWDAFSGAADGSDGGCFVGVKVLDDGGTNVPYKEFLSGPTTIDDYSDVWFNNKGKSNYVEAIGAHRYDAFADLYGISEDDLNYQATFIKNITTDYPNAVAVVNADVTAHELGHQACNNPDDVNGKHPTVWCHLGPGTDRCLMAKQYHPDEMPFGRHPEDAYSEFCHDDPDHIDDWRDAVDDL